MSGPKAYGTFIKRDGHTFRTKAHIQWGEESDESIGCCLLLNPGGTKFVDSKLEDQLLINGGASGQIKTDPTMQQLIKLVERIYKDKDQIRGKFHIHNLFNLQNTTAKEAINEFEAHVNKGEYRFDESLITSDEMRTHPFILLG